ncbi:MAG: hypothetical protein HDS64_06750 [Bacteroidales bacterium]|nr:hypothetical protein [Bacteroidales bacterium]
MQALELPLLVDRLAESVDSARVESTRRARRQALNLIAPVISAEISERGLALWALSMQADGYSVSTITFYLKVISAMMTEIGEPNEAFLQIRRKLSGAADSPAMSFDALKKMVSELSSDVEGNTLGADLTLMAILWGGLRPKEVLSLEFGESYDSIAPLQSINEKYKRPRARKLFPIASAREIAMRIRGILRRYGLETESDSLWALAALKAEVEPEEILSVLGHVPAGLSLLGLFDAADTGATERLSTLEIVADSLADNPFRWYAMQLRRGEDYETIAELSGLEAQNLYYPSREVTRRVGRRLTVSTRPFLPGVVFFRIRPSDVAPLFRKIGSRAWVYRQTASAQSPYAVISPAEMMAFQLAVGVLIDRTAAPAEMHPGDTVEIIGGDFRGLCATIQSTAPNVYRLLLPALNGIPWQIDTSPHLLRPL